MQKRNHAGINFVWLLKMQKVSCSLDGLYVQSGGKVFGLHRFPPRAPLGI